MFSLRARRPYIGFSLTRARRLVGRFTLFRQDDRRRAYRRRGERFADACVLERDRFRVTRLWSGEGYLTG